MKKVYLIIAALVTLLAWREYTRADAIAWAIQDTSDHLLVACEARIDEIMTACESGRIDETKQQKE